MTVVSFTMISYSNYSTGIVDTAFAILKLASLKPRCVCVFVCVCVCVCLYVWYVCVCVYLWTTRFSVSKVLPWWIIRWKNWKIYGANMSNGALSNPLHSHFIRSLIKSINNKCISGVSSFQPWTIISNLSNLQAPVLNISPF